MVEPVMKFCTAVQYRKFLQQVNDYENRFVSDKKTTLIKIYFSVSKHEQELRFQRRKNDPLRQWKLSEVDRQAQELWDEITEMKYRLLKASHTEKNPWYVIRSDDKQSARMETIKLILSKVPYRGRSRSLDLHPNSEVIITGEQELVNMEKQRRKSGHFEG